MAKTQNELRKKLLGGKKNFQTKKVKLESGFTLVVKQPSQKQRSQISKKATIEGTIDPFEFILWSVLLLVHDENGVRVFEDSDYDELASHPTGGIVDELGEACTELLNTTVAEQKKS